MKFLRNSLRAMSCLIVVGLVVAAGAVIQKSNQYVADIDDLQGWMGPALSRGFTIEGKVSEPNPDTPFRRLLFDQYHALIRRSPPKKPQRIWDGDFGIPFKRDGVGRVWTEKDCDLLRRFPMVENCLLTNTQIPVSQFASALNRCDRLQKLWLNQCTSEEFDQITAALKHHKQLRELWIRQVTISEESARNLATIQSEFQITLNEQSLIAPGPLAILVSNSKLFHLELTTPDFTKAHAEAISASSLKTLWVDLKAATFNDGPLDRVYSSRFTPDIVDAFKRTSLKGLSLRGEGLTAEMYLSLAEIPTLINLNVLFRGWNQDIVEQACEINPRLKAVHSRKNKAP